MAFPSASTSAIFVLFLIFAASVLPYSQASLLSIGGIQVAGRLFCSVDGNSCPTCVGLGGVNVNITCNGGTTSLATVLTDTNGFFTTVLDLAEVLLFGGSTPCFATVQLPVANCTLLPTTGILRAPLTLTGNLISGLLGLLLQTVTGLFVVVQTIL
ncbi:uncharacterized protein [Henckelia pumila]|uniref:uncharacterized protein n=1 Tax=Henckelia pumila TaxID=405737 RepID=UPI003C6E6049